MIELLSNNLSYFEETKKKAVEYILSKHLTFIFTILSHLRTVLKLPHYEYSEDIQLSETLEYYLGLLTIKQFSEFLDELENNQFQDIHQTVVFECVDVDITQSDWDFSVPSEFFLNVSEKGWNNI